MIRRPRRSTRMDPLFPYTGPFGAAGAEAGIGTLFQPGGPGKRGGHAHAAFVMLGLPAAQRAVARRIVLAAGLPRPAVVAGEQDQRVIELPGLAKRVEQIGRASCRERVGQYV